MKRIFEAAAGVMLAWGLSATGLWLARAESVGAAIRLTWHHMTGDWMAFLFLTDMGVFTLACLLWMWADLGKRGAGAGRRAAWLGTALLVGSPVFLFYLSRREEPLRSGAPS